MYLGSSKYFLLLLYGQQIENQSSAMIDWLPKSTFRFPYSREQMENRFQIKVSKNECIQ